MRALRLARVALEAEALRWRLWGQRRVLQGGMLAAALIFVLFALALLHIALWVWLSAKLRGGGFIGALIVAGVDVVLAVLLALIAAFSGRGRMREAKQLRDQAISAIRADMGAQVITYLFRLWRR